MDHPPGTTDAAIHWRDGPSGAVPVSRRHDDPYYSMSDGLAESHHVFLAGNDLPARFRDGFHIAELGFGTGLNLMAALIAWHAAPRTGAFRYTSFESHPLPAPDIARALAAFPQTAPHAGPFLAAWAAGQRRFALPGADVTVIEGDARTTLPAWQGRADAWFLDGFAPARNPELWEPALLAQVARHSAPGATLATYTAAGHVRRALAEAGFAVTRQPGHGRKRHMTTGRLP